MSNNNKADYLYDKRVSYGNICKIGRKKLCSIVDEIINTFRDNKHVEDAFEELELKLKSKNDFVRGSIFMTMLHLRAGHFKDPRSNMALFVGTGFLLTFVGAYLTSGWLHSVGKTTWMSGYWVGVALYGLVLFFSFMINVNNKRKWR